ncbi:MAG: phage portal protein, partial [Sphaerochaetaceae bacterium]
MGLKSVFAKTFKSLLNLNELFTGHSFSTDSGELVGPESVKRIFAVYACVNVLAESLATLPLKVYQKDKNDDRSVAADHPLAKVIASPNPTMTAFDFF